LVALILDKVGAPEAFGNLVSYTEDQLAHLNDVENTLNALPTTDQRVTSLSGSFDGPATPSNDNVDIALGGASTVSVSTTGQTADSICAANPTLAQGAASLGFASCQAFVAPFLDKSFYQTTLWPLISQEETLFQSPDFQTCLTDLQSNPSVVPDVCNTVFAELNPIVQEQMTDLLNYGSQDFHCDGGYGEYNASDGATRTCIFAALAYTAPAACYAGSRPSPFDTGSTSVCVYYSRDYIQSDGSCRTNYSLVAFNGRNTCRWSTLPLAQPAIYSVDIATGDRVVLEQ
jgi:hypothetical protein